MSNRKNISLGFILVIIGIAFMLFNLKVCRNDELLLGLGAAFLISYIIHRNNIYLVTGLTIAGIGVNLVLARFYPDIDLEWFLILFELGILFLILYYNNKSKGFIYVGLILPALAIYTLSKQFLNIDTEWILFFLLSFSFYLMYIIVHRKEVNRWPLVPSGILAAWGLIFLLTSDVFGLGFWSLLSFIWPAILILIGIRIIFNKY